MKCKKKFTPDIQKIITDVLKKFTDVLNRLWHNKTTLSLMYLIPIMNIIFIISNVNQVTDIIVKSCTVFSSTAAATACTIKGIKTEENDRFDYLQAFSLVLSVVSFMCCLIYETSSILYLNIYIIFLLTAGANCFAIRMYVIANNQIQNLYDSANEMVKNKDQTSKTQSEFNIGMKEEK